MGWILSITIDRHLFLIEIFRLIRIGFASQRTEAGPAKAIIFGIWKLEMNITFAIRENIVFNEIGES